MRYCGYFSLVFSQGMAVPAKERFYRAEFNAKYSEAPGQCLRKYIGAIMERFEVEGISLGDVEAIGPDVPDCPFLIFELGCQVGKQKLVTSAEKNLERSE